MATPHEWLEQRPECRECGNDMQPEIGQLTYEFEDFHVDVRDVPMSICTGCGKRIVPGPVAVEIDDFVRDTVEALRRSNQVQSHVFELDRLTLNYRESDRPSLAFA